MNNLIILGSGRSGTSAVAGLFRNVEGVFYGYDVLAPTDGNATGYFEDEVVNTVNNVLLRQMTRVSVLDVLPEWLVSRVENRFPWTHRDTRSLWLALPRHSLPRGASYDLAHLMGRIARHQPFCLKDPRFGFTLPMWRPYLPEDVLFLAVFRHPVDTIRSILRDAVELYGDRPLPVTERWAMDHWKLMYESILAQRAQDKNKAAWLFVEFPSSLSGSYLSTMENFCNCSVDAGHIRSPRGGGSAFVVDVARIEAECGPLFDRLRAISDTCLER